MDDHLKQTAKERAVLAVALLEQVLSGKIDPQVAPQQWPSVDADDDPLLGATWHDLSHFSAGAQDRVYVGTRRHVGRRGAPA